MLLQYYKSTQEKYFEHLYRFFQYILQQLILFFFFILG